MYSGCLTLESSGELAWNCFPISTGSEVAKLGFDLIHHLLYTMLVGQDLS